MAYDASKESTKVLGTIDKNDRGDSVVVSFIKNKSTGSESLDIRMYYTDKNTGEKKPTQKGVRLNAEFIDELIEIISKANEDFDGPVEGEA